MSALERPEILKRTTGLDADSSSVLGVMLVVEWKLELEMMNIGTSTSSGVQPP